MINFNDKAIRNMGNEVLNYQIVRLMIKRRRLEESAKIHERERNFPMQNACLVKMRKIERLIQKMSRMTVEIVQFT
jgi:hypothetical protein